MPRFLRALHATLLLLAPTASLVSAQTTRPAALFNPARHMRVSEVRIGMKGYGLTVFHGTQIERFPVEVVDIVRNFNPGFDAVLVYCDDPRLKHSGSVQGMSGSPIFLTDDAGRDRLIGAFAFGYALAKDPLVGVQPIEYMLEVANPTGRGPGDGDSKASALDVKPPATPRLSWNYRDAVARASLPVAPVNSGLSLSSRGLSPAALSALTPALQRFGVVNLQANTVGGRPLPPSATTYPSAKLEPGASLAIPMLTGDIELSALGTCTEVLGDSVFGLGHPFENGGDVELPLAGGYVNAIVSALNASFKLGGATETVGVLRADTACGVGGILGGSVPTIPLSVCVVYDDGSIDRTLHFNVVRHPRFTPLGAIMALSGSLSAVHELPIEHTLTLDSRIKLPGNREVRLGNTFANAAPIELIMSAGLPLAMLTENPFGKIYPESIETTVRVQKTAHLATITAARAARTRVRARDTVTLFADYDLFHQGKATQRLELKLPPRLPPGDYAIVISDGARFAQDDATQRPERLFADTLDGVIAVMNERAGLKANCWYVRLTRDPSGLAMGRVAFLKLPGTKRQLLENSARPNLAPTAVPVTSETPAPFVVSGAAELTLTVEAEPGVKAKATQTATTSVLRMPPPPTMPPRSVPPALGDD